MAAKPTSPDASPAAEEAEMPARGKLSGLKQLCGRHWILMVLVFTVVAHGLLLICWPEGVVGAKQKTPAEIDLGTFRFINNEKNSRLAKAEFNLHVSLLLGTENAGGHRLTNKKFLVQQGIEELLRQAHAADFDDPTLAELKRQIQEKVNEAVEMRTVEAVIITQLETLERAASPKNAMADFDPGVESVTRSRLVKASPASLETKPASAAAEPVVPHQADGSAAK